MPKVVLPITPQTQVRSTAGDGILFRIPFDKLRPEGQKRFKRLEKYNRYKDDLFDLANDIGFKIPADEYFRILYFIPMPKTWRKWKRAEHNGRRHQLRPDKNNLDKAFEDALLGKDEAIWDSRSTKVWTDDPVGRIEVVWGEDLSDY